MKTSIIPDQTNAVADDEIDLLALLGTIWRGKWTILLCAFLAVFAGGYYAFSVATPLYPAQAVVALETKQQNVVDIESVLSGSFEGSEDINTEVEVIRSRNLIGKLVGDLNLVEDPEFNEHIREINPYHPIVFVKSILGIEDDPETDVEVLNEVIDNTINVISVSNIRNSLVFSINVTTEDPEKSALIANTLADIYIQDAVDLKFKATEQAGVWLSEKAAELKQELELSEFKVKQFSGETQLINEESLFLLSRQLKDMRQRLEDLNENRLELSSQLKSLEVVAESSDYTSIAGIALDSRLSRIATQLDAGTGNQAEFDARLQDVMIQLRRDAARSEQQYNAMVESEKTFSKEIDGQSTDLIELQQLEREAEANGLLYESFLSRLKETTVQKGLQRPDSRLLSSAVPRDASSPRKGIILVLSFLLGVFAGIGMILLKELRNNSFQTVDDLEGFVHLPVLGSIPRTDAKHRKDVLSYAVKKPTSVFAESIRNLRTSVLLSNIDQPPQVIMSTSSVPGEGKTTQSLTLAQNMAGLGKRVLVLEGDIRKRVFAEYFDIQNKNGFMSVMAGDVKLSDAVFQHEDMGIDILIGEQSTINAADVFSSESFKKFMDSLRKQYDYIIVDSAPVLAVPDARVIGQHVDAIIYSVLWNSTTKTQLKQGISMFQSVGLTIDGLVLSNIDAKEMKRRGYGGQYAYGGDGGYYDN